MVVDTGAPACPAFKRGEARVIRIGVRSILIAVAVCAAYGYFERESSLEDEERVRLFNKAFEDKYIQISQPSAGQPLVPTIANFKALRPPDQRLYGEDRWNRMRRQALRFVAAVNQGLGDPFTYSELEDRAVVLRMKEASLRYLNPFDVAPSAPNITPIHSSEAVARRRAGWRIVSTNLLLYLRPGAAPVTVAADARHTVEIGGEFRLPGRRNGAVLTIRTLGEGKLQALSLDVSYPASHSRSLRFSRSSGEYFMWDGRAFCVYRADAIVEDADDELPGDLVFTKLVNGAPVRVNVLGRATANLVGSQVGGETSYIDGAFRPAPGRRLILTVDPELQAGTFYFLLSKLNFLDSHYPSRLDRPRQGAVTILDAATG